MTAGIPGAGIGGLFYLASTILLPVRSAWRRVRGRPDDVSWRQQAHSLFLVVGIAAALWATGLVLAFVVPDEALSRVPATGLHSSVRTVLPVATFGIAVGTLVMVLAAVEVGHHVRNVIIRRSRAKNA